MTEPVVGDGLRRVLLRLEGFDLARMRLLDILNGLGETITGVRMNLLNGRHEIVLARDPDPAAMRADTQVAFDQFVKRMQLARGELYAYGRDALGIPTKRLATMGGITRQRVEELIRSSREDALPTLEDSA